MKRNIVLFIDTSQTDTTKVAIEIDGVRFENISGSRARTSQLLLPLIEKLLSQKNVKLSELTAIEVATGPGSFTGLRVGIAIANTLSTLLGIPVNGKQDIALPHY